MKNWKSTLAFFIFIAVYVYTILIPSSDGVIETSGHIALLSSFLMMMRSDFTSEMLLKMIDNMPFKGSK